MDVIVTLDAHGPLFDGSAPEIVRTWLDEVKQDVAQDGANKLRAWPMDKTGRATGRYQSMITVTTISLNDVLIHDPVVYGPWLEGVSKRNSSTRFKGYRLWRLTRQYLKGRAQEIEDQHMPELVRRLGG